MKKLLKAAFLIFVTVLPASAQSSRTEREIRNLLAEYEQAVIKLDSAFVERVWANDFTYSRIDGTTQNRKQALEYLTQERDEPTSKIISYKIDNREVRVMGNAALATGDWTVQSAAVDSPADAPHTDKGRITIILEKRNGKWMIVAEHESEQPHDRKLMEQEVLKAGSEGSRTIARQDRAALERLVANGCLFADENGITRTKAEGIADLVSSDLKIESEEISSRKVHIVDNNTAVETGIYNFKGVFKDKPIMETGRYTITWVFRAYRWQIAASHTSIIK